MQSVVVMKIEYALNLSELASFGGYVPTTDQHVHAAHVFDYVTSLAHVYF
jgi:hypothetical protein